MTGSKQQSLLFFTLLVNVNWITHKNVYYSHQQYMHTAKNTECKTNEIFAKNVAITVTALSASKHDRYSAL